MDDTTFCSHYRASSAQICKQQGYSNNIQALQMGTSSVGLVRKKTSGQRAFNPHLLKGTRCEAAAVILQVIGNPRGLQPGIPK